MPSGTPNYGLVKADDLENYDVSVVNANLDSIDTLIGGLDTRLDTAEPKITELETKQYCLLRATAAQNIPNNSPTTVDFATNVASAGVTVSLGSNNVTVTKAGLYIIAAGLTWDSAAGGTRLLSVNVDGNAVAANAIAGFTGGFNINAVSIIMPLAVGAVILLQALHTQGATLATGPVDRTFLSLSRIGAS